MFSFLKENFLKLSSALKNTSLFFSQGLADLFKTPWNQDSLDQLESLLYKTDMGSKLVQAALKKIKKNHPPTQLLQLQQELITFGHELLKPVPVFELKLSHLPTVILVVGTNGSGKTTFCAKLAHKLQKQGQTVLLGAADTFRAAAIMQLEHFATNLNIPIVKHRPGADPAAVCFDAIKSAVAKNIDVVILDSAGRLEHKKELMNELKKIHQSCSKALPGAPHYTFLNLDASCGQSALIQAQSFHEATNLSAVVLSKFDGSAKGGILLALTDVIKCPIAYLGTGEALDDLLPFEANSYLQALFANQGSQPE